MINLGSNEIYWQLPKPSKSDYRSSPLPLAVTVCPDSEKMAVAYDSNKLMVFDIHNRCLHSWSRKNDELFPSNFLKRYNRIIGATAVSATKFLFYTNYTYMILDV